MFRSGRTRPAHAHGGVVAHPILGGLHLGTFECRFRKRQVTGYPEARNSGLRRAGQGDTKHRRRTFRPIHGLGRPVSYCRDNSDPSEHLARHHCQAERVVEFAIREQTGVGRDDGSAKLKHQSAVDKRA